MSSITWQDDNTLKMETDAGHADASACASRRPVLPRQPATGEPIVAGRIGRAVGSAAARVWPAARIPLGLGARVGH